MERQYLLIAGLCSRLKTEMHRDERVVVVPDWAGLGNLGRNHFGRVAHRCRVLGVVEASRGEVWVLHAGGFRINMRWGTCRWK